MTKKEKEERAEKALQMLIDGTLKIMGNPAELLEKQTTDE